VFRSRAISGPYEARIVLSQRTTPVNGPHQGAWVKTAAGSDWFFHFQDKRAYGRVVHLQPMRWQGGWPLIGAPSSEPGVGQPVLEHAKPVPGTFARREPAVGDEFDGPGLGPQWQWAANPQSGWSEVAEGRLRLFAQPPAPIRSLASVLTQKFPAPVFGATAQVTLHAPADGDQAGFGVAGLASSWFGIRRVDGAPRIVLASCDERGGTCVETLGAALPDYAARLRIDVTDGARVAFSYSSDGRTFVPVGAPFDARMGRWVGAQLALFATGAHGAHADIEYLRIAP